MCRTSEKYSAEALVVTWHVQSACWNDVCFCLEDENDVGSWVLPMFYCKYMCEVQCIITCGYFACFISLLE